MRLWRRLRDRLRRRGDSEHAQALLRALIVSLLLVHTAWIARHDAARGARLWAINLGATAFSILLLARIVQRPAASIRRRVVGAIHDNVATTAWLAACGPAGALALFVYPFVTVGNGFRYGVGYLAFSGLLGALGLGTLIAAAPGWESYGQIGVGVLLSHVVVTGYTGALLRRLHETRRAFERMATCDVLTGLPNRRFFMERLAGLVAARDGRHLACLYMDLDGFKAVNDRCGHRIGDELLNTVGREVLGCIRASDMLARLGGDEFTVVLDAPGSPAEVADVAARIIRAVEGIRSVGGHPVAVSASVGAAFVAAGDAERCTDAEALLKAADDAMYAAKRSGKGCYRSVTLDGARAA